MTITINYKNNVPKKDSYNLVLFIDEKYNISSLKKYVLSSEYSYIFDLLKTNDLKKKIISFDINSKKKIILISLKQNLASSDAENLGAKFYDILKNNKQTEYCVNSDTTIGKLKNVVGYFLHGLKLKSYSFEKYKSKKNKINISIIVEGKLKPSIKDQIKLDRKSVV